MIGEQVVEMARGLIGVPYRHQGRDPNGIDCMGIVAHIADQLGLEVRDRTDYGRVPSNGYLEAATEDQPYLQRIYHYEPGAVLLMRFTKSAQHGAIFAGDTIIHAYQNIGRVSEHRFADVWKSRVVAIYGWRV